MRIRGERRTQAERLARRIARLRPSRAPARGIYEAPVEQLPDLNGEAVYGRFTVVTGYTGEWLFGEQNLECARMRRRKAR